MVVSYYKGNYPGIYDMRLVELEYIYPYTFILKFSIQYYQNETDLELTPENITEWCSENLEGKYKVIDTPSTFGGSDLYRFIWVTLSSESDSIMFKTYWQPGE